MIYFYVLLLRIVAYLEGPAKIVLFIIVFSAIGYSTLKRTSLNNLYNVSKVKSYSFFLLIFILLHSFVFGKLLVRDIAVLLTYWIWFVFTYTYLKNKTVNEALKYIFISFLIFNISNYLFYEIYFSGQKRGINTLMKMVGVLGYRIYFPLSSGANVFTFQLGVNALLTLYFVKTCRKVILYIAVFVFYIFMLILADSRLILIFTLFFAFIYWFSMERTLFFFKKYWYVLVLSLSVFIYIFYKTSLFDGIKRPGEKTGEALSRIEIWTHAFDVIFNDLKFVFGKGLNGLENSLGDYLKDAFEEERLQTSHSFIIQNIIDFGLIGTIIILFYVSRIIKMLIKLKSLIINIIMVMFLLIGATESIPTFYSFEATIFIIAILSTILINNERKNYKYN